MLNALLWAVGEAYTTEAYWDSESVSQFVGGGVAVIIPPEPEKLLYGLTVTCIDGQKSAGCVTRGANLGRVVRGRVHRRLSCSE